MAGFDARITSPFRILPVAIYSQMIAEDNGSGFPAIPNRWLALFGGELWAYMPSGSVLRSQLEYANTNGKWYDPHAQPDYAYRQYIFFAGYRYRGATIGHPTDADSETWALRVTLVQPAGQVWSVKLRHGRLDDVGSVDLYNPLTRGPSKFDGGELAWEGVAWEQHVRLQLGYEHQGTKGPVRRDGPYGYLQWVRPL